MFILCLEETMEHISLDRKSDSVVT